MPTLRRAGQTRHKGKLLSQVGGVPREEYDDAMSSPDILSSIIAPTVWKLSQNSPTPTNPAKRAKIDSSHTTDDLAKPDAPNVAKVTAKSRSRQASVDTETSTSSRSKTKNRLLNDDEADLTDSNPHNYLGAPFTGKNSEDAKKDAERKVRRVSPERNWDDGKRKRKQKAYGGSSKMTYKSATTKNTAATSRPKIDTPTDCMLLPRLCSNRPSTDFTTRPAISIDSGASEDEKPKKKPSRMEPLRVFEHE
ncbi:hypothetical protein K440DRAFT_318238 [Wilcoxina mikolae CBS 423.85]|nr:hypothetical protein K440DRAFT_318238 [Wilcoxina mikolae CBS 423.85]